MITRAYFARVWLPMVGAVATKHNLWAVIAWMQAEGSAAKFNPLATTFNWIGATNFNSIGVKNYPSLEVGLEATAQTLNQGADREMYGYKPIRHRLRKDAWARNTLRAVEQSRWGTGGLALQCLPWVKKSWEYYAKVPIGQ